MKEVPTPVNRPHWDWPFGGPDRVVASWEKLVAPLGTSGSRLRGGRNAKPPASRHLALAACPAGAGAAAGVAPWRSEGVPSLPRWVPARRPRGSR